MLATGQTRALLLLALLFLATLDGCKLVESVRGNGEKKPKPAQISEQELRSQLFDYADKFSARVQAAAERVVADNERDLRREAVEWMAVSIPQCRKAVFHRDPRIALIDTWTLTLQMHNLMSRPEVKAKVGERISIIAETCDVLLEAIEGIARPLMTQEAFEAAREELMAFAEEHPVGEDDIDIARPSNFMQRFGGDAFGWAVAIPLSPFRALQGIDEGAVAIREFTSVADRFARFLEEVPLYSAWQLKLLLLDIEDSPTVITAIGSLKTAADQSRRLVDTAEKFPEAIGLEARKTIQELETTQAALDRSIAEIRATVNDSRTVVTDVEQAIGKGQALVADTRSLTETAESTAKSFAEAGQTWTGAIEAFQDTVRMFQPDEEDEAAREAAPETGEEEEGGRPFDILDYANTAERLSVAAVDLRELFLEFNGTVQNEALTRRIADVEELTRKTLDETRQTSEGLLNQLTLRGLLLIVAAFLAAVAYRLIFRRRAAQSATQ